MTFLFCGFRVAEGRFKMVPRSAIVYSCCELSVSDVCDSIFC